MPCHEQHPHSRDVLWDLINESQPAIGDTSTPHAHMTEDFRRNCGAA